MDKRGQAEPQARMRIVHWVAGKRAVAFDEAVRHEGEHEISIPAGGESHERLYLDPDQRWVLQRWSEHANARDTYRYLSDAEARSWLALCEYAEDVERQARELLSARIEPTPAPVVEQGVDVHALLDRELVDRLDVEASAHGESRSAALGRLLTEALEARRRARARGGYHGR